MTVMTGRSSLGRLWNDLQLRLHGAFRGAPVSRPESGDRLLSEARFVVIDLELTGLDASRDEILEVGAIAMRGASICLGETLERKVRPTLTAWSATVPLHRILPADVVDAPSFDQVIGELQDWIDEGAPVGHLARVDRTFLSRRVPASRLSERWIDTAAVAAWLAGDGRVERLMPAADRASLLDLAKGYGVNVHGAHRALTDAYVTAQIWQRQMFRLQQRGVRTVSEALRIGGAQ